MTVYQNWRSPVWWKCLDRTSIAYGLKIRSEKIKIMINNFNGIGTDIRASDKKLETVHSFKYLGAIVTDERSKPELFSRIE